MLKLDASHRSLDTAFRIAMGDLLGNVAEYQDGLLTEPSEVFLAGLDYVTPWTRDAAINSWNGTAFVDPEITRATLLSVLDRNGDAVSIGGQYWDAVILATGAWHYYLATGDRELLRLAREATITTLDLREREEFDLQRGLFRGAACYGDGVGAYPVRYTTTGGHSTITRWVAANPTDRATPGFGLPMMTLSTNCLYEHAYRLVPAMSRELGVEAPSDNEQKANRLRAAINASFWNEHLGRYTYLVDENGGCDYQEGMGQSLALLFGIADEKQAKSLLERSFVSDYGVPCLWPICPRFERMGDQAYGIHNGSVWPHIQGLWGHAALRHGRQDLFIRELTSLANAATRDHHFGEYYSPFSGELDHGLQEGWYEYPRFDIHEWTPCSRQTWSATAFLRLVVHGMFGVRLEPTGMSVEPMLPWDVDSEILTGVRYRGKEVCIHVRRADVEHPTMLVDGVQTRLVSPEGTGRVEIVVELPHEIG